MSCLTLMHRAVHTSYSHEIGCLPNAVQGHRVKNTVNTGVDLEHAPAYCSVAVSHRHSGQDSRSANDRAMIMDKLAGQNVRVVRVSLEVAPRPTTHLLI